MIAIFKREINTFLNSLIAYIVISVFVTAIGLLMWVFPETNVFDYGYADLGTLFNLSPYIFLFLIPAITMRMFSEEKKTGTIELLMTRPLRDSEIVLGKYFAGVFLVFFSLVPTLIYFITVYQLSNPVGNVDISGIAGSYIGLFLLGCVFTSIGIFSSALSENQIVAFVIGVFLCFFIYTGFSSLAAIDTWGSLSLLIDQMGIIYHYNTLSKGLIDSRDIVYFFSVISIMLLLTHLILSARKW